MKIKKSIFILLLTMFIGIGFVKAVAGDVNNDGKADSKDVDLIRRYISQSASDSEKKLVAQNGDIDGDGFINLKDATELDLLVQNGSTMSGYVDGVGCESFKTKSSCERGETLNYGSFKCKWSSKKNKCKYTGLKYVVCGFNSKVDYDAICEGKQSKIGSGVYDIPPIIPQLTSFIVNALKIVTPVILIIIGMITMVKSLTSSNEDEIKKAQNALIKKLIIAAMVFFVIGITQFVVSKVADANAIDDKDPENASNSVDNCFDLFLNGNYDTVYYRAGTGGRKCASESVKK